MRLADVAQFASGSLRGNPTRTLLMILAMSIGVASVVVLTALGEGARLYVVNQFSSLGTNLVIVLPGRTETAGIGPGMLLGQIPREITLDDAEAILRSRAVKRIAPLTVGTATLSRDALNREVVVLGSTSDLLEVRHMSLGIGKFLPPGDIHESASVCVLGNQMKRELFGNEQAVGQWVRLGDRGFRVIGVLGEQGESMGMRTDELVIIPVASAHQLFNTSGLFRIMIEAKSRDVIDQVKHDAEQIMFQRHNGEKDVSGDHPGRGARHLRSYPHRADLGSRRHRRDQPGCRGSAHHERDADRRGAARQGDRSAQGAGRTGPTDTCPVFRRGGVALRRGQRGGIGTGLRRQHARRQNISESAGLAAMVGGAGSLRHCDGYGHPVQRVACAACGAA